MIQINKSKLIIHVIALMIPLGIYMMFYNFIKKDEDFRTIIAWVMIMLFMLFAGFFVLNVGQKIEIIDKTIIITRMFYQKEVISLKNVTKCEVITGVSSYGRAGVNHYNEVDIYYTAEGENKKVEMTDTLYTCYNELVRYMDYFVKCDFIDGINYSSRSIEIH